MNYREDLEYQLQKVTLAIQEVIEDVYISDEVRQERIRKLINFKESIMYKEREPLIDLEAAQNSQVYLLFLKVIMNCYYQLENKTQSILMLPGTLDLILLIMVFVGLQAWWIIPIIKRNNKLNDRGRELRKEIKQLERLYKK